jgi:hypothetical protein
MWKHNYEQAKQAKHAHDHEQVVSKNSLFCSESYSTHLARSILTDARSILTDAIKDSVYAQGGYLPLQKAIEQENTSAWPGDTA